MSKESRKDNCIHFLGIREEDQVVYLKDTASGGLLAKKRTTVKENIWDETEWSTDEKNKKATIVDLVKARNNRYKEQPDYVIYELNPFLTGDLHQLEEKIALVFQNLKPSGHLVLLMENPFSLHNLAGETDRQGKLFSCFEKHPDDCLTIGYKKLKEVLTKVFPKENLSWYYPYPTLDFPVAIYSDSYLPKKGECVENYYNFKNARLELFDETDAFDEVVKSGMFQEFANCYMVVIGEPLQEELRYCRYSNERRKELRIRTDILPNAVRKVAYQQASISHIQDLCKWEEKLNQQLTLVRFMGRQVAVNHIIKREQDCVYFEFVEGESLEQHLDKLLLQGQVESAKALLLSFCKLLNTQPELGLFEETEDFHKVFGKLDERRLRRVMEGDVPFYASQVTDIDMICQNVLISDGITVIDYEWTFDFPVPVDYVIYRILFFYLEFQNRKSLFGGFDFYEALSITEDKKKLFEGMEASFQKYVQGDVTLLGDAYFAQGKPVLAMGQLKRQLQQLEESQIEIRMQTKKGLCREYRSFKEDEKGVVAFTIDVQEELLQVSILPGFSNGMMRICLLQENREGSKPLGFTANGTAINPILYLFDEPACIEVCQLMPGVNRIYVSLEVVALPDTFVVESKKSFSDFMQIAANREEQLEALKNSLSWKITKPLRKIKGNE